ncbi:ROK family protein [Streptomyces sp. NPDC093065]|uniref:ROK family protein n=1 Tax=Streptomyces sp. NPDC093065 TaxID=3366021 RepID=UPI00382C44F2
MPEHPVPSEYAVAVDVGGTSIKGAVVNRATEPVAGLRRPTPRTEGPRAVVDAVAEVLRRLAEHAPGSAAGVMVTGVVDEPSQRAVYSATLGRRGLPLSEILSRAAALPVTLGHDVWAGGMAETRLGAAQGADDVLFCAIGTGIAAAPLVDGRPVSGHGHADELGHVVTGPEGTACGCGGHGCLEFVASAAAAYSARSGRTVTGAAQVAGLKAACDPVAEAVWARAVTHLATALASSVSLVSPQVVVMGGGLSEAGELLLGPLREQLDRRLTFHRRPTLVRAAPGDEAGCLGAGLLAWQTVHGATGPAACTGARDGARRPATTAPMPDS